MLVRGPRVRRRIVNLIRNTGQRGPGAIQSRPPVFARSARCAFASVIVAGLVVLNGPAVFAAGFQLNEHGAVGTGRAGAVISTINDPSAIYHNPAALIRTEGTQFSGGLSLIIPEGAYIGRGRPVDALDSPVRQELERTPTPVPHAYLSHAISDQAVVGLGFYNHYGLGVSWQNPDEFVGRTLVQEITLRTFFITPAIALKLSDRVSVSVGVTLVPATISLTRVVGTSDNGQVVFPGPPEGTVDIRATAFGVGAIAGLHVNATEHLRVGFTYRSAVDLSFEGDADFQIPDDTPASIAANFPDQTISGDLTIPHTFLLGVGWEESNWTVELAGQVTMWTSYDELEIVFDDGLPVPSSTLDRSWNVAPMVRLGGEYRFDFPLAVRLGVAYDVSPVPNRTADPTLTDNDRIIGSAGLGYDFGRVRVDAAYMAFYVREREITPGDGNVNFPPASDMESLTYDDALVHLASLSIGVEL